MNEQPKLNPNDAYSKRREDGSVIYWRTGKGSHRHASFYCANGKRDIMTGDCQPLDKDEALNWAPCLDCCSDADKEAHAVAEAARAETMCPNSGLVHNPQRIQNQCSDCGKWGTTNRATGRLRAHKPLN